MSNINNQTQDLYSIKLVQDLDHEDAATVSGGALVLSSAFNGRGIRRTFNGRNPSVGNLNNIASWYNVTGTRDWLVYTGSNFTGRVRRLTAGRAANLPPAFNNVISSARPA